MEVRGEMENNTKQPPNKVQVKKAIDWKEISKDLRADLIGKPFAYRAITYFLSRQTA